MRRFAFFVLVLAALAFVAFWLVTTPERADASALASPPADVENGRLVFFAGGCASCHAIPGQPDRLVLGGGTELKSPFGTFVAPNISPDPQAGIGNWTEQDFASALLKGTSPDGRHFYPAFPYTIYQRMKPEDVRDLFAFIKTLPPSANAPRAHDFPLDLAVVRRGIGLWKRLHLDGRPFAPDPAKSAEINRGAYLVEALGHCAECHSPRDITGGIIAERRFAGGPSLEGKGNVPNITPGEGGIGDWAEDDLVFMLEDGSTPEGDVVGGEMAKVIQNTSQLPEADRRAMALYLKSLPPVDDQQTN